MALLLLVLVGITINGVHLQSLDRSQDGKCLSAHNILRALHQNTGTLEWDSGLAEGAQQWALRLARTGSFDHSRGKYGENLYKAWGSRGSGGSDSSCVKATLSWYNEEKDYDYNRGGFSMRTGHFTQLVWKGSTKLGVGIAKQGSTVVVVARYTPAGNFRGRYQENVQRRKPGARTPSLSELNAKVDKGGPPQPPQPVTRGPPTEGPPVPETSPPDCRDKSWSCRWKNKWSCRRSSWVRRSCPEKCGMC